jgi:4-hydroxybenzoate polyprenyltransferase
MELAKASAHRWDVLRLDYLFAVLVPCLIALYITRSGASGFLDHLRTILGWAFLGIAGNVINDIVDKDRDLDWKNKELGAIAIGSIVLSVLCFVSVMASDPMMIVYVGVAIVLVFVYCIGLKKIPIASGFVQVFAEVCMPYFSIHVPDSSIEWFWLVSLFFFSILSQFTHEAIDKEAVSSRFSLNKVRIIVFIFSGLTLGCGTILFLLTLDYNILPVAFVPFATIYMFRKFNAVPAPNIKNIGIIIGNFYMIFFLVLILA